MQKRVLITGGAGYIGSHAVKFFLEKNYQVFVFDNLSTGYKEPMDILQKVGDLVFTKGDLTNKSEIEKVFAENKIDVVLHFAAKCSVDESMKNPYLYFYNNVFGTLNLLEAMRQNKVNKLIFSSTCAVYGETEILPVDELHPTKPANPYGESKLKAESIIKWYGQLFDLKFVILRYFNVCGASVDGLVGDSKKPSLLLMQNAVRGAMQIEPFYFTCSEVDTPDGTPIRDYIDVEDLVSAHYQACQYLENDGKSDILNLGNGSGYSVQEIVSKVEDVFKIKMPRKNSEARKGEYAKIYSNPKKAETELDWKCKKNLEQSILSLKNWYEKYPGGYRF
jgi:UDP-glucose 4-epimerase